MSKPEIVPPPTGDDTPMSIAKPEGFSLNQFRSTRGPSIGGVETLLAALPHHRLAETKDWVRLHPTHWTEGLCFVSVPIVGQKRDTLHLIHEDLATRYLPSGRIQRIRLALATKPYDRFFLCHIPTTNLDNSWNKSNLEACERAKTLWVQAVPEEGMERYKTEFATSQEAFPQPNWPARSLEQLIEVTWAGCMITADNHPALLRLIGAKQEMS